MYRSTSSAGAPGGDSGGAQTGGATDGAGAGQAKDNVVDAEFVDVDDKK
jgi:hypothetical protein